MAVIILQDDNEEDKTLYELDTRHSEEREVERDVINIFFTFLLLQSIYLGLVGQLTLSFGNGATNEMSISQWCQKPEPTGGGNTSDVPPLHLQTQTPPR